MSVFKETILLDTLSYNKNIKRWTVPILSLPGIKVERLYINGKEIPINKYSIDRNDLLFSDDIIDDSTKAYLIITFNSKSILLTFWLPIIIAGLGFFGTVSQPILHAFGLLYSEKEYIIKLTHIGYSKSKNQLDVSAQILQKGDKNFQITDKTLREFDLVFAINQFQNAKDIPNQDYDFLSDPIKLTPGDNTRTIYTDKSFTEKVINTQGRIRCITFLIRKEQINNLKNQFSFSSIPENSYVILSSAAIDVSEDINLPN
jgi:hypothetical protein